jgi:proteasome lid subunit RPN8/RPN11
LIHITKSQLAELITHALREDPTECCGFLIGADSRTSSVRPTQNIKSDSQSRFEMDEAEVKTVLAEAELFGDGAVAVYHSHTYTQGYPSATDVKIAVKNGWAGYHHVVISLAEKTRPVVRAFMITADGDVVEEVIQTD